MEKQLGMLQVLDERMKKVEDTTFTKPKTESEIFLEPTKTSVNPWLRTALNELTTVESEKYVEQSRETLKSTIKALLDINKATSTKKIAAITGKERNTESYYLNKLCRMGLVTKQKRGRQVLYKIIDGKKVQKLFPEVIAA